MKNSSLNKRTLYIVDILLFLVCIITDRISKIKVIKSLKGHPSKAVIKGILEFRYLENSGAAFGILKEQISFFLLVGIIVMIAVIYVIYKSPAVKKSIPENIFLSLIAGGAIGNFLDRVIYGYVIDFVYFRVINFPVFNVADIYLSIGTFLLIIYMLFYYKEYDLLYMEVKERKLRDINK